MDKAWYIHKKEYYTEEKMNEIELQVSTWMKLTNNIEWKKFVADFGFQCQHVKCLEVITALLQQEEQLNKLKINDFSWTHQGFDIREQTATLKSGETGNYKEWQPRSAYQEQKALEP